MCVSEREEFYSNALCKFITFTYFVKCTYQSVQKSIFFSGLKNDKT